MKLVGAGVRVSVELAPEDSELSGGGAATVFDFVWIPERSNNRR